MRAVAGVTGFSTQYGTQSGRPPADAVLARLAARQHGVVGLRQLRHHGFTASGVRSRVARGRLHRVHRGVYAVGHPLLSTEGRWMAAVLACGPGALLSHGSAASLWGLRRSARARIDVISTGQRGAKRAAIDAHSGATLHPAEATVHDGIPCTTVARTLVDLADVLDRRGLERACEQAEMLRLFDADALADVLSRAGGRRGAARLSAIVAELRPGATLTRSELEERFLALCRSAGVTQPLVNVRVEVDGGTLEVDFLWRDERLVVETDGHAS